MKFRIALAGVLVAALSHQAGAQIVVQPRMGDPLNGLTPAQLAAFFAGRDAYDLTFDEASGLGPGFNDNSCGSCHNDPVTGGSGVTVVTRFGLEEKGEPFDPLDVFGGTLLQDEAISDDCLETVPPEATVVINRVTPLSLGLGLVEAIPEATMTANETASLPGGSIHWVGLLEDPGAPLRPGRMGWKAQVATVLTFSGDATLNEMGITNPLVPDENMPNGDAALLAACDAVPDPEDDGTFINLITDFQRLSAGPPQTPKSGMTGEQIFIDTGCANCHLASTFVTDASAPEAALQNASFKPYSDYLLHDMGDLGDGIVQGAASETEIRTPSLWGLRYRIAQLHDGRSNQATHQERVVDAIIQHGGTAQFAVDNFNGLSPLEVDQLSDFLGSLGRREFDKNFDNVISEVDFESFMNCFTGPGTASITPDDECAVHDIDQDGDVDLTDFDAFLTVYIGVQEDCDGNGTMDLIDLLSGDAADCNGNLVPDTCDVDLGTSNDLNGNDIPDECEMFIRSDCNADGLTDIADPVSLLDYLFGATGVLACDVACDSNSDGALDIADTIFMLNHQFAGGADPEAPFPTCGIDLTPAAGLDCDSSPFCP